MKVSNNIEHSQTKVSETNKTPISLKNLEVNQNKKEQFLLSQRPWPGNGPYVTEDWLNYALQNGAKVSVLRIKSDNPPIVHSTIKIESNGMISYIGFWPKDNKFDNEGAVVIEGTPNRNNILSESKLVSIDRGSHRLTSLIKLVNHYNKEGYNIVGNNCSHFAVDFYRVSGGKVNSSPTGY
jgi:hypothetical protein